MRVAIAGGGEFGQAIAQAVLGAGHKALIIERQRVRYRPDLAPAADWMLADACELASLQAAGIHTADVVIAATGDDAVNLVFALLCKTEFGVPRVVARVNDPDNQWLFTHDWGVDVAVSTPRTLVTAAEQAVSSGQLVRLMTLQHGQSNLVEITLSATSTLLGKSLAQLDLPADAAVLAVTRVDATLVPTPDLIMQEGDELILLVAAHIEDQIRGHLQRAM